MTVGIAAAKCTECEGVGLVLNRWDNEVPCDCTLRAVFHTCLTGFVECVALGERTASVSWEPCYGPTGGRIFSRKREEYIADFLKVTERSLTEEDHRFFRYHYLLGADADLCCQKLKMERPNFFYAANRIEHRLGRIYAELKPYPLYPLRDYFGGFVHKGVKSEPILSVHAPATFPLTA